MIRFSCPGEVGQEAHTLTAPQRLLSLTRDGTRGVVFFRHCFQVLRLNSRTMNVSTRRIIKLKRAILASNPRIAHTVMFNDSLSGAWRSIHVGFEPWTHGWSDTHGTNSVRGKRNVKEND